MGGKKTRIILSFCPSLCSNYFFFAVRIRSIKKKKEDRQHSERIPPLLPEKSKVESRKAMTGKKKESTADFFLLSLF
jgi:hypothetical protein